MPTYRIALSGKDQLVCIDDEFVADHDAEAILIADWLFDAVSELYSGYQLWSGTRRFKELSELGLSGLCLALRSNGDELRFAQEVTLERERVLAESNAAVMRSRKFLREMSKLTGLLERTRTI